ncbi:calcium-activated chloride channel regulator 1-like isoform X3 [Ruditapes philippinarum]|uniref:calcium-activated chloride channel regulator 1-like isoform X3 n=1 Tax=Ruditapes philippinarum TaxID=129788 RepID=UPI00295C1966|nr:calcium-activated chloride channel regulator 1-like isoform X3 [Ruditapes philippinarum]
MPFTHFIILISLFLRITGIILKDGGYEDIFVLIHESNDERDELLQAIKNVITNASQLLFKATHNQIYFRKIKIIIPKTWSRQSTYKQLPTPPLKDSFFSVDKNGDKAPQAKGHFLCGKAGQFIHLSDKFLMAKGRSAWGLHGMIAS